MRSSKFGFAILFVLLAGAVAAVWAWQDPGVWKGPMTDEDVAYYMAAIDRNLDLPPDTGDEIMARLRAWAEADDGRPVYMLNLMRFYPEVLQSPGLPEFHGTPEEANTYYEQHVMPTLFRLGGYPLYFGHAQWRNLLGFDEDIDNWGRIGVVRYPSRRAFLELLADPDYAPYMPYKLMALQIYLTPMTAEVTVPELPWAAGALALVIFLAAGWWRAARR